MEALLTASNSEVFSTSASSIRVLLVQELISNGNAGTPSCRRRHLEAEVSLLNAGWIAIRLEEKFSTWTVVM